ncbi:glycosyltransferase family 9 protein [Raineyella fluvialis]|uniref:Glycosyltransferase family 9 protein n=1 Tax=Raineyella fluvialis TaxID=2662261 RepID=A0A5Q2FGE2_9ACTN|nr:glycosyltransferase family 9 protein [Raineyella fluvialis]QGF24594.1 glycosyltransferase family 9 protein [Raineyella fluvialis]
MTSGPVLLALRALKLGDLLVAVPALRALRRAFPDHRVLYAAQAWLGPIVDLVGGVELLDTHGLDVPIPLPVGAVDVAVNLHGAGPQSRHRLDVLAPRWRVGHRSDGSDGPRWDGPHWDDDLHERVRWTRLLEWHGIQADPSDLRLLRPRERSPHPGAVVLHPGAAYGSRLWPVERFGHVGRALTAAGHEVVVTGSAGERGRAEAVARASGLPEQAVLAGRLGLAEMASVVSEAAGVVSADTGAAHLASAYGRPSVVLFGPAPISQWGPPVGPHLALTDESVRRGDTFADDPDPALLAVGADDVLRALEDIGVLP